MIYHSLLYIVIAVSAIMAVMAKKLLNAAIMLAVMSIAVSLLLFNFNAPWAGVFELSVCAGLITVLFISAVSLIKKEDDLLKEGRIKYAILPFLAAVTAILSGIYLMPYFEYLTNYAREAAQNPGVGEIIWTYRSVDLLGQLTLLACAVFVIKAIFAKRRIEE
ncbi:MAG: hypothetical protein COT17_06295 [Elusimicrobia bacterium CG08_land_8_20_14_0_20_51_18]|nr:MAG: hypothetical protein COT17_06295 [Elusimicrobia bacterium CG08_land_8_20_14_0_20_51_18]